jgi:hypothetical protein
VAGCLIALTVCGASTAAFADPLNPRSYFQQQFSSDLIYPAESQTLEARARDRAMSAFSWKRKKQSESAFRPRKIALLRYATPVQFGQRKMLFKFRAPGKGKSIATFELKF